MTTHNITMAALLAALWGRLKARRPGPFAPVMAVRSLTCS